jgi:hypothetical protein
VVFLPRTLKMVGEAFLYGSSVERLDLSMTTLERVGDSFCVGCCELRETLLPGTLVCMGSAGAPESPVALLVLPVADGMGIGRVCAASVLSGLVGLGLVRAHPIWPAQ